jgi:dTMP kinase
MKADVPELVNRLIHGRGLNYWEAGMDLHMANNLYDSFIKYQSCVIEQFDKLAEEYNFVTVDANNSPEEIFEELKEHIKLLLYNRQPKTKRPK